MKNLFVTFRVEISSTQYDYAGTQGSAKVKVQIPDAFLITLDAGTLFDATLAAALANFHEELDEKDKEKERTLADMVEEEQDVVNETG